MEKYKLTKIIAVTCLTFSLTVPYSIADASTIPEQLRNDASELRTELDTKRQSIRQEIERTKADIKQNHEVINNVKEDLNVVKEKHDDIEQQHQEFNDKADRMIETVKQDKADYDRVKQDVNARIDAKVEDIDNKVQNVENTKDNIVINTPNLPDVTIKDKWFNDADKQTLQGLLDKLEQKVITDLQYERKVIDILNHTLKSYLKLHQYDFNFDHLLNSGFDISTLSERNKALIERLQNLKNLNKISDDSFNMQSLEILKNDLKEKADKLEQLNAKLKSEEASDLTSDFADNFVDNIEAEPAAQTTAPVKQMSTSSLEHHSNLPDSGERRNTTLVSVAILLLIVAVISFLFSRKRKK